ncbi:hypothetical protein GWI33_012789, partial [Rhynchophorus ferrugineus]
MIVFIARDDLGDFSVWCAEEHEQKRSFLAFGRVGFAAKPVDGRLSEINNRIEMHVSEIRCLYKRKWWPKYYGRPIFRRCGPRYSEKCGIPLGGRPLVRPGRWRDAIAAIVYDLVMFGAESSRYIKVLWKDVRVGDLIHLSNNEVVPADILVLKSSDPSGLCYIDTGHLDGETNLKQRQVARGFIEKHHCFDPSKFRSKIEVEAPTTKIYRFHGAIVHPSGGRVPVGTDNLLLRECLLKNTDFVEGIVVYA